MYIVFPPEYRALAEATYTQAQQSYPYTIKVKDEGLLDLLSPDTLAVTVYDMEADKASKDLAQYRWDILKAMAKGVVFVNYADKSIDEAHFFNTRDDLSIEDQIDSIIVAAKYAEQRSQYYKTTSPKAIYAGPTYVVPLSLVVTRYDAKQEDFSINYDSKIKTILASLPEDVWPKTGFATARMSASLHKFLDSMPETAIVTFDKKPADKVESYQSIEMKAPRSVDREFGINYRNTVKRKEIREEE